VEGRIVADRGRQRLEEVLGQFVAARIVVDVSVEDEAGVAGDGDGTAIDLPALHSIPLS